MTNERADRAGAGRVRGAGGARALGAPAAALCVMLSACGGESVGEPIAVRQVFGGLGDVPGRFGYPRALDISPPRGRGEGLVWVVDKTGRVQGLNPADGRCEVFWRMPETDLGKPVGITIGPGPDERGEWCDELVWIPDTHYYRVLVFRPPTGDRSDPDHAPTLVRSLGSYGTGPGQFRYPTDVAVLYAPDGRSIERVYVSEYGGNDRISVFDSRFEFLFSFGSFGAGRGDTPGTRRVEFDRPQAISIETIEGRRELVVVDSHNHRVGRFTLDGDLVAWFGSRDEPGDALGRFRYPQGIASMGDGTALVVEYGNNRVQHLDLATGRGLAAWGRPGRGEGELAAPWAVGILGRTAFVLDSGNSRLLAFNAPRPRR